MKKAEKEKNILDLKHQRNLNYLNILIILIISSFITIVIGTLDEWKIKGLVSVGIIIFVIVLLIISLFEYKLSKIRNEIIKLR